MYSAAEFTSCAVGIGYKKTAAVCEALKNRVILIAERFSKTAALCWVMFDASAAVSFKPIFKLCALNSS